MILYSPDGTTKVDCHPGQVENMKRKGYTEEPPKKSKHKSSNNAPE